jgi:AcrR family transcriptional regulator
MAAAALKRAPAARKRPAVAGRGTRLAAPARERQILEAAVRFFAEAGFAGQTRELMRRLGITQPLLYRYFPTKRKLIERVFEEVFVNRVDPKWIRLIGDRSQPLAQRLTAFYQSYAASTYRYEWIRIYTFSGLAGEDFNRRYIKLIEGSLLRPICNELRHYCCLTGDDVIPISVLELEHLWVVHGGLFYYAVRKHIYQARVGEDFAAIAARAVNVMLEGMRAIAARHEAAGETPRLRGKPAATSDLRGSRR